MPIAPPELPTRGRLKPDFRLLGLVVGIAQADENEQFVDRKTLTIARILQSLVGLIPPSWDGASK
jgi:hypothetical protein